MSGGNFSLKTKKNWNGSHSFLQIVAFVKKSGFFFSETKTSHGRNFLVYTCFVCVSVCVFTRVRACSIIERNTQANSWINMTNNTGRSKRAYKRRRPEEHACEMTTSNHRYCLWLSQKTVFFRTSKKSAQIAALYPVSSGARPAILSFCTVFDRSTLRVQI